MMGFHLQHKREYFNETANTLFFLNILFVLGNSCLHACIPSMSSSKGWSRKNIFWRNSLKIWNRCKCYHKAFQYCTLLFQDKKYFNCDVYKCSALAPYQHNEDRLAISIFPMNCCTSNMFRCGVLLSIMFDFFLWICCKLITFFSRWINISISFVRK